MNETRPRSQKSKKEKKRERFDYMGRRACWAGQVGGGGEWEEATWRPRRRWWCLGQRIGGSDFDSADD